MKFYPIETNDGTVSLFNFEIDDVYHSKVGAYKEALFKYVIPSEIIDKSRRKQDVKILDVCYGLGYNAKAAVNELHKLNINTKVHVDILENDVDVLAFSSFIGEECYQEDVLLKFNQSLFKSINVKEIIEKYMEKLGNIESNLEKIIPGEYKYIPIGEIKQKIHNIYYQSISNRNTRINNYLIQNLNINYFIDDARASIKKLDKTYDFIFLDPFTPSKAPTLWTKDFFEKLYNLMDDNGCLTTYSSAAPVRAGLIEAGFYIGRTDPIGKKTSGTIAYKNKSLVESPLSEKELGILRTKAGIPYRDYALNFSIYEILNNWEVEKRLSNRISSSKFLKSLKEN